MAKCPQRRMSKGRWKTNTLQASIYWIVQANKADDELICWNDQKLNRGFKQDCGLSWKLQSSWVAVFHHCYCYNGILFFLLSSDYFILELWTFYKLVLIVRFIQYLYQAVGRSFFVFIQCRVYAISNKTNNEATIQMIQWTDELKYDERKT